MKAFVKTLSLVSLAAVAASCSTPSKNPSAPATPTPAASPSPVASAKAKAATAATPLELKCELKTDSRTITVVPKDGGCELNYLKFGKSEVVASSAKGTEHCDEVRAKMRKNLEAAGFSCK